MQRAHTIHKMKNLSPHEDSTSDYYYTQRSYPQQNTLRIYRIILYYRESFILRVCEVSLCLKWRRGGGPFISGINTRCCICVCGRSTVLFCLVNAPEVCVYFIMVFNLRFKNGGRVFYMIYITRKIFMALVCIFDRNTR